MNCRFRTNGDGTSTCTRKDCGNKIAADCERTRCYATCKSQAAEESPSPAVIPRPRLRSSAENLRILSICSACEHCTDQANPAQASCREIIRRGKAKGLKRSGRLMHPRGIPSPNSACPLGLW